MLPTDSYNLVNPNAPVSPNFDRLPRSLHSLEVWSFGLTGHIGWIGTAAVMHAALGIKAMLIWLPLIAVSIVHNLQIKQIGARWLDMAGGTPNYVTRLLPAYPGLARYAAIGYYLSWLAFPAVNAIILANLVEQNLAPFGIECPKVLLEIGFTAIAFIVALNGTRALGILHLFLVVPALSLLLAFCLQGLYWLAFSPQSPGFFPSSWPSISLPEWFQWYFVGTYCGYAGEIVTVFVADSQQPRTTLKFLNLSCWVFPPIYWGGSWVLARLATGEGLGDDTFLNLIAAAQPFWGELAPLLVTFLIVSSCLLGCATSVAACPRILYQLALDKHLSPLFSLTSLQGGLEPALLFSFILSLVFLVWGDIDRIVIVSGSIYLATFMLLRFGLWWQRRQPDVLLPWVALGCLLVEIPIFFIGGWLWGWQDFLAGLLLPIVFLAVDAALRRLPIVLLKPQWWKQQFQNRQLASTDFVALQVSVLIVLVVLAAWGGWTAKALLAKIPELVSANLLVVLLVSVAFVAVAVTCWTTLPQAVAIVEAREKTEQLFNIALNPMVVLDEKGKISQVNPATENLCQVNAKELIGMHFSQLLSGLSLDVEQWPSRSEQTINYPYKGAKILEVSISARSLCQPPEYIAIFHDITERRMAEIELRQALQMQEELTSKATSYAEQLQQALQELQHTQSQLIQTEKMSSLGQLVAGVAHEINNPVNFIFGNLVHANNYAKDLIDLVYLYQQQYAEADAAIEQKIEDIDLEFLMADFPKILGSMKMGAERIRQIVLTLRNFSRLDEAEMKEADLHEGIDSTLLILQVRLKTKAERSPITIVKDYGDLPLVECYPGQLNQAFMNLINNAIDALHQYEKHLTAQAAKNWYGLISISTALIDGDWVRISIKDNGPGIPSELQSRLFDPFFTTKPVGEGTGLGLSISYQIVTEKHGGRLKCISQPDSGAEFQIEIPIRQAKVKRQRR